MLSDSEPSSGKCVYLDGIPWEESDVATSYCDGDQGEGYSWNGDGMPHQNTSTRAATEVDLDDHIGLISSRRQLSFRVVAQVPYASDDTWPTGFVQMRLFEAGPHGSGLYYLPSSGDL